MKFLCPSCEKVVEDTAPDEFLKSGSLIECDACYEVFQVSISRPTKRVPDARKACPHCSASVLDVEKYYAED